MNPIKNITREAAIKLFESKFWEPLSYVERARFQLFTECLCMPFDVFHEAMEKALGRPVWTHEFSMNLDGLKRELIEGGAAPTMEQIIEMIPAEKRVLVVLE